MKSMWQRGGLTWWQVVWQSWRELVAHQLSSRCAEVAYYFLFSTFPLLIFLTDLLGYTAGSSVRLRSILFHYLARVAPSPDVAPLLQGTLEQITARRGGGARLSLSLLVGLWVAANGMLALGRTLNTACVLEETRPWWRRRLEALGLTLGFALLIASALIVLLYGREIGAALADRMGEEPVFVALWHILRWPLILVFVLVSFEGIYNYAPNLPPGSHRPWGTPGAVIGVGLWVASSFGLRFYLLQVQSYATTYGSVSAVIVLLLWFYLSAFAVVAGGQVNSVISRRIATHGHRGGAKVPGAGRPGARRRRAHA
jgi:membrane protein